MYITVQKSVVSNKKKKKKFLFCKNVLMCLQQATDYAIKSLYVKKFVNGKNYSKTPLELEKKHVILTAF